MKRGTRRVVSLEHLEDRWVPATVRLVAGNLLISGQTGALTLTQTAANQIKVQDGATKITVAGFSLINITGTNNNDSITLNLGTFSYTGNLLVNSGNGADTLTVTSAGTAAIQGNTTMLTGLGNDTVNLNSTGAAAVRFGGSVVLNDSAGTGTVNFGNATAATTVGGDLNITGWYNTIGIGLITTPVANVIGGRLIIQAGTVNTTVNVLGADGLTVQKGVQVTTGSGTDIVRFRAVTVNGDSQFSIGDNNNPVTDDLIEFGQYATFPATATASFNGNVTITQGSGRGVVQVAVNTAFNGNLTAYLNEGDNRFTVDSVDPGFSVAGNLAIYAGNGDNNIATAAVVSGSINIQLGNGDNLTTVVYAPGGKFTYRSGNGLDTVLFNPVIANQSWVIDMVFGSNDDNLIFIGDGTISGVIDGGVSATGNTIFQGTWTFAPNLTIARFP